MSEFCFVLFWSFLYFILVGGVCFGFFKYILLSMLLQLFHFFSTLYSPPPCTPLPPPFSHLSSCPWVVHISSLASPFPILLLTAPCLFCTYCLSFLFPILSPCPLLADSPLCDLHFCDSVPVLVVCLVLLFVF